MVAWESNPTAGFLIADMGPYLGSDWPPFAPALTGRFPADAGEIDYYVLDPAVDDYRTMGFTPSGTDWSDSYVWTGSGTLHFGAYTDGSSSGPPSGAHIYVAWYDTSYSTVPGAPSVTPESLIPASYSAVGELPPPPPPTPTISTVQGDAPGRSFPLTDTLPVGHTVTVTGDHLDVVDQIQLPGLTVLAADFLSQDAGTITFTLPTDPGILSGPLRVASGALHDDHDVSVLRPETSWHTPDVVTVTGDTSQIGTDTDPESPGQFKTVGSSRVGDTGTPSYNDTAFPPEKMGYDSGTIGEQITAVGIDSGSIPGTANLPAAPDPPGVTPWLYEYDGQPTDQVFSGTSPSSLVDALTAPIQMRITLSPTYTEPRLSDTSFGIYGLPVTEVTDTDSPGNPDTHITRPQSWFTSDKLIDAGDGPNYQGTWTDNFDPTAHAGWVAVSTTLSHTSGFAGGGGLTATGAGEFRSPPVGATPTFPYRMDYFIGNAPAAGGTVQVGIAWLDASGTQISVDWGSSYSVDTGGSFTNRTWVSATAPDDPAVWSRQLVFQFSGCASLEVDSVNFRTDAGSYTFIRDLTLPSGALYVSPDDHVFIVLIGVTGPGLSSSGSGALAYALTGATATGDDGAFHPRVSYQPTNWRYWLPAAIGTLPPDIAGWQVGSVAW